MVLSTKRVEKHRKARYAKVVECVEGHYETEEVPFGTVYRWCTECFVAECGCGERMTLTDSMTTCAGCGTDHAVIVQERLPTERAAQDDEILHPWRLVRNREGASLPC